MGKQQTKDQLLPSENKKTNRDDVIKKEAINKDQNTLAKQTTSKSDKSVKQTVANEKDNEVTIATEITINPDQSVKISVAKISQPDNLPPQIFGVKVNKQAIFDTVISERASRRQGTHKVKDRAEVRGGGKKPWRQKGTGRARAGSTRSPIWVGGGRVFGPTPERNYNLKVNKKVRKLALNSALSLKSEAQAILIHDFVLEKPSTKQLLSQLQDLNLNKAWKKFLIINENEVVFKSAKNVKALKVNKITSLLVEDVLNADAIIFGTNAWERLAK